MGYGASRGAHPALQQPAGASWAMDRDRQCHVAVHIAVRLGDLHSAMGFQQMSNSRHEECLIEPCPSHIEIVQYLSYGLER